MNPPHPFDANRETEPGRGWRIELLGRLRAVSGSLCVTRFRTQKTAVLLAFLACHPHRAHPRETLVELLWPDEDEEAGRQNLRNALSALRRQLELPGLPADQVLLTDRFAVQLNPARVTSDLREFETLLCRAEQVVSGTERALLLSEAVALYDDEFLPGFYEEWILAERERLAERYLTALRQLMLQMEQAGDLDRAVTCARQALQADPLREETHVDLMRLLSIAGQLSSALRQYRQLETVLERELDERPSPEARALGVELEQQAQRFTPGGAPLQGDGAGSERARALYRAGLRAHGRSESPAALAFMEESVAIFRELGDPAGLAYSLCFLGSLISETGGSKAAARAAGEEGLAIFRGLRNRTGIAYALLTLGRLACERSRFAEARRLLEEHVALLRQAGSRLNLARALISLGDVAGQQGDGQAAHSCLKESLALARATRADGLVWWLEELAADCAPRCPEQAVHLFGAGAAAREGLRLDRPEVEAAERERALAAAREVLGEPAFQSAWRVGSALTPEEAIQHALETR